MENTNPIEGLQAYITLHNILLEPQVITEYIDGMPKTRVEVKAVVGQKPEPEPEPVAKLPKQHKKK